MIDSEKVIIPGSPPGFQLVAVCDICQKRQTMFNGLPEGWQKLGNKDGKYHFCSSLCKWAFLAKMGVNPDEQEDTHEADIPY